MPPFPAAVSPGAQPTLFRVQCRCPPPHAGGPLAPGPSVRCCALPLILLLIYGHTHTHTTPCTCMSGETAPLCTPNAAGGTAPGSLARGRGRTSVSVSVNVSVNVSVSVSVLSFRFEVPARLGSFHLISAQFISAYGSCAVRAGRRGEGWRCPLYL